MAVHGLYVKRCGDDMSERRAILNDYRTARRTAMAIIQGLEDEDEPIEAISWTETPEREEMIFHCTLPSPACTSSETIICIQPLDDDHEIILGYSDVFPWVVKNWKELI